MTHRNIWTLRCQFFSGHPCCHSLAKYSVPPTCQLPTLGTVPVILFPPFLLPSRWVLWKTSRLLAWWFCAHLYSSLSWNSFPHPTHSFLHSLSSNWSNCPVPAPTVAASRTAPCATPPHPTPPHPRPFRGRLRSSVGTASVSSSPPGRSLPHDQEGARSFTFVPWQASTVSPTSILGHPFSLCPLSQAFSFLAFYFFQSLQSILSLKNKQRNNKTTNKTALALLLL